MQLQRVLPVLAGEHCGVLPARALAVALARVPVKVGSGGHCRERRGASGGRVIGTGGCRHAGTEAWKVI